MMYLKFDTQEQAETALINAGFTIGVYRDKFSGHCGWGTIFRIPLPPQFEGDEQYETGVFVNVYECEHIAELAQYEIEAPTTPYNVVSGCVY
jgi:hypothetical protein